jgi:hypothetical protein
VKPAPATRPPRNSAPCSWCTLTTRLP